jgi:hypothetical protein
MAVLNHIFFHHDKGDVESCCGSHKFPVYSFPAEKELDANEEIVLSRPILLIGHDIPSDLLSLKKADFDITDVVPVVAIINTLRLAREMFKADDPG